MKEKIYTIPVMDAFREGGECPFCNMYTKLERSALEFVLGPSYMEDDVRIATNISGFCESHYALMYEEQNRLGLGLMVHTHMTHINKQLISVLKDKNATANKKKLFQKNDDTKDKLTELLDKLDSSCYMCDKVNNTMERYLDTFFLLYSTEKELRELISNGRGFCLPHFKRIMKESPSKLNDSLHQQFKDEIVPKQLKEMEIVMDDLDWFLKKFDYRYQNEPWKNAKDSLPRAIQKLSGEIIK